MHRTSQTGFYLVPTILDFKMTFDRSRAIFPLLLPSHKIPVEIVLFNKVTKTYDILDNLANYATQVLNLRLQV